MCNLLFVLGFIFAFPSIGFCTTYYASPSGSGTSCSVGTPCSLTQGITTMSGGRHVNPGRWHIYV